MHSYKHIACTFILVGSSFCALGLFDSCCLPLKFTFLRYENVVDNRSGILESPRKVLEFWENDRVGTMLVFTVICSEHSLRYLIK